MAELPRIDRVREGALSTVLNSDATLADGARFAGDYDNSTGRYLEADVYLYVLFDTGPPSAGTAIAELYVLFGDGETAEVFANGGDGSTGSNHTPAAQHFVDNFVSVAPSTSVTEVCMVKNVKLSHGGNRFVVENISGQTFDAMWQVDIKTKSPSIEFP